MKRSHPLRYQRWQCCSRDGSEHEDYGHDYDDDDDARTHTQCRDDANLCAIFVTAWKSGQALSPSRFFPPPPPPPSPSRSAKPATAAGAHSRSRLHRRSSNSAPEQLCGRRVRRTLVQWAYRAARSPNVPSMAPGRRWGASRLKRGADRRVGGGACSGCSTGCAWLGPGQGSPRSQHERNSRVEPPLRCVLLGAVAGNTHYLH